MQDQSEKGDPGVETLLLEVEGLVPDEPNASRMAGQEGILLGGRNEAELVGAEDFHGSHSNTPKHALYLRPEVRSFTAFF